MTADDILLEAFQMVDPSSDGCLAEHLGGLLEGSCRDETVGLQSGAGDTLEYQPCGGGLGSPCAQRLQTLTLERRVLAAHLSGIDDVAFLVFL